MSWYGCPPLATVWAFFILLAATASIALVIWLIFPAD
jgi:hypothetical protein